MIAFLLCFRFLNTVSSNIYFIGSKRLQKFVMPVAIKLLNEPVLWFRRYRRKTNSDYMNYGMKISTGSQELCFE